MLQRVRVKLRAYDHSVLLECWERLRDMVRLSEGELRGPIPLPRHIRKFDLLRSPHVNKKARDQLEIRTHTRLLFIEGTEQTIKKLQGLRLPNSVDIDIFAE